MANNNTPKGMSPEQQRQLLLEALVRYSKGGSTSVQAPTARSAEKMGRVFEGLMDYQLAPRDDPSTHIALQWSRRTGKSYSAVPTFISAGMNSTHVDNTMFFISKTLDHAYALLWRKFQEFGKQYSIPFEMKQDPYRIIFPTGAILYFRGAKDLDQLGVLEGFPCSLVWMDEAQMIRDDVVKEIQRALNPALRDLGGKMIFSGTAGTFRVGEWFEITNGLRPHWSVHKHTLFENTHLRDDAKDIETILREEGLKLDSPQFRRSYMNEWVEDNEHTVYKFDLGINGIEEVSLDPALEWHYVMGVDWGYRDDTAVVVGAYSYDSDTYYEVDEWSAPGKSLEEIWAEGIEPMIKKYNPETRVADHDPRMHDGMNSRFGAGLTLAEKPGKEGYIEIMNSDMRKGKIKTPVHFGLVRERQLLVWDPNKFPKMVEHPGRPNHRCDAALYAYRAAKHWIGKTVQAALTFDNEADREAYYMRQYILSRAAETNTPAADWANDNDF